MNSYAQLMFIVSGILFVSGITFYDEDAEYRQADKKARELADAQRTIEEYIRQEQSRDQQQKRKRNDLE